MEFSGKIPFLELRLQEPLKVLTFLEISIPSFKCKIAVSNEFFSSTEMKPYYLSISKNKIPIIHAQGEFNWKSTP